MFKAYKYRIYTDQKQISKKLFIFVFFIFSLFASVYAEDVYYFRLEALGHNNPPVAFTDPRIFTSFYFTAPNSVYILGVTSITSTARNTATTYEHNVISLVHTFALGYRVTYLGKYTSTTAPKELTLLLPKVQEYSINPKVKFLATDKDKKLFGMKINDHIIKDKTGKIVKIEYVTATADTVEVR